MKLRFLTVLVLAVQSAFAQTSFVPVDREQVQKSIQDSSAPTYYPLLMSRYLALDTTLTNDEYRLLYYGFAFQDNYNPYGGEKKKEIVQLINDNKYMEAIMMCDTMLNKNPLSLSANSYKGFALFKINENDPRYIPYRRRYDKLREAILSSGDGLSCKTAFKTLFVSDEYDLLYNYFEVDKFTGQSLKFPCDCLHIKPSKKFSANKMYFDTSETFMNFDKKMKADKGK